MILLQPEEIEIFNFSPQADNPGSKMQEISILISNKKNESFQLDIDRIWIK